jgi:hypothetical protein
MEIFCVLDVLSASLVAPELHNVIIPLSLDTTGYAGNHSNKAKQRIKNSIP